MKPKPCACPLCPGPLFVPTKHTLQWMGMHVCDACAKKWLVYFDCTYQVPMPKATAWVIQVHYQKLAHIVDVATARRLVLADYMGLEVDVDELAREYTTPWTT